MKILAFAFLLFASTVITIDSSKLGPGREQVWIDGNRRDLASLTFQTLVILRTFGYRSNP